MKFLVTLALAVSLASPVTGVSGYFTYLERITLTAYDSSANVLGNVQSAFSVNYASSGQGTPNELLQFSSLLGISSISIAGGSSGGSFVMDDFTYNPAVHGVPELGSTFVLMLIGVSTLARRRQARHASVVTPGTNPESLSHRS